MTHRIDDFDSDLIAAVCSRYTNQDVAVHNRSRQSRVAAWIDIEGVRSNPTSSRQREFNVVRVDLWEELLSGRCRNRQCWRRIASYNVHDNRIHNRQPVSNNDVRRQLSEASQAVRGTTTINWSRKLELL